MQPAVTSIGDLSNIFKGLLTSETAKANSIEGLAYASMRPQVKNELARDEEFLANLVAAMKGAPAKSSLTYGALTILVNLTSYKPVLSEEQKRMTQLKAYADSNKSINPHDPLDDDSVVTERCLAVFKAGVVPIMVSHCQHGSPASRNLVISIIFSLSKTASIRGSMAQQGSVKLLLQAYPTLDAGSTQARTAAHALARILISTNPQHIFGGSNPVPLNNAIPPLCSILTPSQSDETPTDLLPVFETLLALTNLASVSDGTMARDPIIRSPSMPVIEELMLSSNTMVSRAATELLCNLVQSPLLVDKYSDGTKAASQRMQIILALADANDPATRRAAGGALASLLAWAKPVNALLERGDRAVDILLGMCKEEEEGLAHRGVVCLLGVCTADGATGIWGQEKAISRGAIQVLKDCLKASRNPEVLQIAAETLQILLTAKAAPPTKQALIES